MFHPVVTMATLVAVLLLLLPPSVMSVLSQDPEAAAFEDTYRRLAQCSVPSHDMFVRKFNAATGDVTPSEYDIFCRTKDQFNNFMCTYYDKLVQTYFSEYCSGKQNMDRSAQWHIFSTDPNQPCGYLTENLKYEAEPGSLVKVFQDAAACQTVCANGNRFCLGFAFALSVYDSKSKESLTDDTNTNIDVADNTKTGNPPGTVDNVGDKSKTENPPGTTVDNPASGISQLANKVNGVVGYGTGNTEIKSPLDTIDDGTGKTETQNLPGGIDDGTGKTETQNLPGGIGGSNDLPLLPPVIGTAGGKDTPAAGLNTGTGEEVGSGQRQPEMNIPGGPPEQGKEEDSPGSLTIPAPKDIPEDAVVGDQDKLQGSEEESQDKVDSDLLTLFGKANDTAIAEEANITVSSSKDIPVGSDESLDESIEESSSYSAEEDLDLPKEPTGGNDNDIFPQINAPDDKQTAYQPGAQSNDQPETKSETHQQTYDGQPNRNILKEEELRLLEEESSSSHFLAYTLTAIILIMVTYIMYHNKQKIVAIIVEGKGSGNGRRRRYNQNTYTTLGNHHM